MPLPQPVLWSTVTAIQASLGVVFVSLVFTVPEGRSPVGVTVFASYALWCLFT